MKQKSLLTTLLLVVGLGAYTVLNTATSTGFGSYQSSCGCHGAATGATTVAINAPTFYTPGASYPVTVTVTNTSLSQAGFQIQTNIGTLSSTDPTVTVNGGGLSAGHNQRKSMVGNVATFNLTWTAPTPGGTAATFNAVGNAVNGSGTGGDQWNSAPSTNVALPVSFTNLTAKQLQDHVLIRFETHSEENVKHFELERGTNGTDFSAIAQINPSGNNSYEYRDYEPAQNIQYYYRIKEVSKNEEFTYSEVIRATAISNNTINVYPTILENNLLTISGIDTKDDFSIALFDLFGRKVFFENLETNVAKVPNLNSAYYYVAIYKDNQLTHSQKVFVK